MVAIIKILIEGGYYRLCINFMKLPGILWKVEEEKKDNEIFSSLLKVWPPEYDKYSGGRIAYATVI